MGTSNNFNFLHHSSLWLREALRENLLARLLLQRSGGPWLHPSLETASNLKKMVTTTPVQTQVLNTWSLWEVPDVITEGGSDPPLLGYFAGTLLGSNCGSTLLAGEATQFVVFAAPSKVTVAHTPLLHLLMLSFFEGVPEAHA